MGVDCRSDLLLTRGGHLDIRSAFPSSLPDENQRNLSTDHTF
jgi:hypothetical protein